MVNWEAQVLNYHNYTWNHFIFHPDINFFSKSPCKLIITLGFKEIPLFFSPICDSFSHLILIFWSQINFFSRNLTFFSHFFPQNVIFINSIDENRGIFCCFNIPREVIPRTESMKLHTLRCNPMCTWEAFSWMQLLPQWKRIHFQSGYLRHNTQGFVILPRTRLGLSTRPSTNFNWSEVAVTHCTVQEYLKWPSEREEERIFQERSRGLRRE